MVSFKRDNKVNPLEELGYSEAYAALTNHVVRSKIARNDCRSNQKCLSIERAYEEQSTYAIKIQKVYRNQSNDTGLRIRGTPIH